MKTLVIDSSLEYDRAGLLEDGELKEIIIQENQNFKVGDIFVAKVKKIIPKKFAFLDLGYDKNAFLALTDKKQKSLYKYNENNGKYILNLKEGQDLLVQIDKEGTRIKGASVTTNVSLTGKYVVILLNEENIGISKKIEEAEKREELKEFAKETLPQGYGIIFRTNCNIASLDEIKNEILELIEKGKKLLDSFEYIKAPSLVFSSNTEIEKLIIDILKDEDKIIINNKNKLEVLKGVFENIILYEDSLPIFEAYSIESKIEKAISNKIWLKSGGFLVIDCVEAFTIIDVNSGKNIAKNLEDMIFKTNKEALEKIAKEIRLRNISGMILIDLIDMKDIERRKELELYMKKLAKEDRMPIVIYPVNELGILQITRKKSSKSLLEMITMPCPTCLGSGVVKNEIYVANNIKNQIISIFNSTIYNKVYVYASEIIINYLENKLNIRNIEKELNKKIELNIIKTYRFDYFYIEKYV